MFFENEKLDELEEQEKELRRSIKVLSNTIQQWRDKRDLLNESSKKLRNKAIKQRQKRNMINKKVQETKKELKILLKILNMKQKHLHELDNKIKDEKRSLPMKSTIENDLKQIEWKIQTTPTIELKDREEELILRAIKLKKFLKEFTDLEKLEDRRMACLAEIKSTMKEIRNIQNNINSLIEESQEYHNKMIDFYKQIDMEREQANEYHAKVVENLEKIKNSKSELNEIMFQIDTLKEKLKTQKLKILEKKKIISKSHLTRLKEDAIRKMEDGKKLSFEELQLIYNNEDEHANNKQ